MCWISGMSNISGMNAVLNQWNVKLSGMNAVLNQWNVKLSGINNVLD